VASNIVRPHVPEDELHSYCDGELSPPQRVEIAEHLLGCLICRSAHAEVEELRARTTALLAIAAPQVIRGPARRIQTLAPRRIRRRLPAAMAVAASAVIGMGLWFSVGSSAKTATGQAASTMSAPAVLPGTALAAVATVTNNENDPMVGASWASLSWVAAQQGTTARLAKIRGIPAGNVRMNHDAAGSTYMVRQQLADGRPVWVVEGLDDDITPVRQLLQASGYSASRSMVTSLSAGSTNAPHTTRTVAVFGHLPVDSLNVLVQLTQ
jgi:anti-sigma factor RsiW